MLKINTLFSSLCIIFLLSACTAPKIELEGKVFRNFNILTLENDTVLKEHILVLQGDTIRDILPEKDFHQKYYFPDSLIIEGNGRYIMPSFHDMHAHL